MSTQKTIKVKGIDWPYEEQGMGKHAVVFIHGGQVSGKSWNFTLWPLLPANWHCYAPDMRGHGRLANVIPVEECFAQMADDIYEFSRALKLDKFILVGLSLGGRLSLQVALEHPEILKALIMLFPANPYMPTGGKPEVKNITVQTAGDRDGLIKLGRATLASTVDEKLLLQLVDDMVVVKTETFDKIFAPNTINNLDERLQAMTVQSMMTIGGKDITTSSTPLQHKAADALPYCKKVVYSNEGHNAIFENPKRIAIEIEAFVKQVECFHKRNSSLK